MFDGTPPVTIWVSWYGSSEKLAPLLKKVEFYMMLHQLWFLIKTYEIIQGN